MSSVKNNNILEKTSFLYGNNSKFIEDLYTEYLSNPSKVPNEWREFFDGLNEKKDLILKTAEGPSWAPKKIKKATTDSLPNPEKLQDLEKRPEAFNLLNIYSSITNSSLEKTLEEMSGKDFSKFKETLAEVLIGIICPIGKKIKDLNNDKSYLIKILEEGSSKARNIANKNLNRIKEIVGFI